MMEIVKMSADHVSQVAALEAVCFRDPWSERSISSELDNKLSYWLVAVEDGLVCGYIGSQTVMGETDMMNVGVHPDCRRKGIGEKLILALIQDLKKEMDSHALTLEVRASNAPAIALYQKLDFVQIGLRKNYYRNPKEDAWILQVQF